MGIVDRVDVKPDQGEILRLLRKANTWKEPDPEILQMVQDALGEAKQLLEPRGVYEFLDRNQVSDHPAFESATRVGLCVCTIGSPLEDRVAELIKSGELVRGVVLDAVGSEMAEAVARVLDETMEKEEHQPGHDASARFSPGYGEWELEGQRLLFDLLEPERIGVQLSASMMMTPRKSVSFAINFGPDPKPPRCATLCSRCDMEDCPYRRE
jgi:hypothetical protein